MSESRDWSNRRRQKLVDRPFQFRFVRVILYSVLVSLTAVLGCVFVALQYTLSMLELQHDLLTVSLFQMVGWMVLLELVVMIPALVWVGVMVTHKVAGPLVRINKAIRGMMEGNYDVNLKLRDGDELFTLADNVNALAASLKQRQGGAR